MRHWGMVLLLAAVGCGRSKTTLVSGLRAPAGIAVDAQNVYFVSELDGAAAYVPTGGGDPVTLATGLESPYAIAVDRLYAYVGTSGWLMKIPLGGGAPVKLAPAVMTGGHFVVTADFVYFGDALTNAIVRVPTNGGSVETLADNQTGEMNLVSDGVNLYWSSINPGGPGHGTITKMPLSGGSPVQLAGSQAAPRDLAVAAGRVFWTNALVGDNTMSVSTEGGPLQVVQPNQSGSSMVSDDSGLYWIGMDSTGHGALFQASLAGDHVQRLIAAEDSYQGGTVAVDADALYFTDGAGGKVYKLSPK